MEQKTGLQSCKGGLRQEKEKGEWEAELWGLREVSNS